MKELFSLHEGGCEHLAMGQEPFRLRDFPPAYKTGGNGEAGNGEYNPTGQTAASAPEGQSEGGGNGEYRPPSGFAGGDTSAPTKEEVLASWTGTWTGRYPGKSTKN